MVSDVLVAATEEIRRYRQEMPDAYSDLSGEIGVVLTVMDALRLYLDAPPGAGEDHDRLVADLQQAIRGVDVSGLRVAQERLVAWARRARAERRGIIPTPAIRVGDMVRTTEPIMWGPGKTALRKGCVGTVIEHLGEREGQSLFVLHLPGAPSFNVTADILERVDADASRQGEEDGRRWAEELGDVDELRRLHEFMMGSEWPETLFTEQSGFTYGDRLTWLLDPRREGSRQEKFWNSVVGPGGYELSAERSYIEGFMFGAMEVGDMELLDEDDHR